VDTNKITAFALSDLGETVYLSSAVNDQLTDYQSKEDFGPSLEGETLGAYYKASSDSYNFVAMQTPTPGAANSGPRVGPIVISEIMYHPGKWGFGVHRTVQREQRPRYLVRLSQGEGVAD
jgi:hypothetical protein